MHKVLNTARIVSSLLLLGVFSAASADELGSQVRFDIPEQTLETALLAFSQQAKVQIVVANDAAKGRKSPAVQGEYPATRALDLLLQGTGLGYRVTDERTIAISTLPSTSASIDSAATGETSARGDFRLMQAEPAVTGATATEQASEPEAVELAEVVVTGTHIRGVTASSSPRMVFDRDDIVRGGFSTVDQFLERLPQTLSAVGQDTINAASIDAATNFGDGTSINLRGLSGKATLVLINGRRVAPSGFFGGFVDVSLVPLTAVERIEILTDGASAIYGSDAVSGVVNFIMRSDYEGAETTVELGSVTDGDMATSRASQSLGTTWDGGSALLAYEFHKRDGLEVRDRDYISDIFFPSTSLLGEQERHNLFASASHELSDRFKLFADVLYSDRDTERNPQFEGGLGTTGTTKQGQVSLGARYRLSDTWSAQAIAGYSDYQLDARAFDIPTSADADMRSLEVQADGPLLDLPGGALRLAVGSAYRQENFSSIGETEATSTVAPERTVKALFGELHIPFVSSSNRRTGIEVLELSLAARYEDYSDFGGDVTPKVGLRWEPVANLNVRATYGESFKAPDLNSVYSPEIVTVSNIFNVESGPLVLQRDFGNPDLIEETAENWTVGFDWRPQWTPLSLSVTYYRIDFDDRITTPAIGTSDIFSAPEQFGELLIANPGAALVNALIANADAFQNQAGLDFTPDEAFDPDGVVLAFDNRQHNLASEKQSGFDVTLDYPFEAVWGRFDLSLNANYVTSFDRRTTPTAPVRDILDIPESTLDLKARAGLNWSRNALGAALFLNYQDDYRDIDLTRTPISSLTTFDLTLRYAPSETERGGFADGLGLSLAVTNLFDKDPPQALLFGLFPYYDTANGDPTGRFVSAVVSKKW